MINFGKVTDILLPKRDVFRLEPNYLRYSLGYTVGYALGSTPGGMLGYILVSTVRFTSAGEFTFKK